MFHQKLLYLHQQKIGWKKGELLIGTKERFGAESVQMRHWSRGRHWRWMWKDIGSCSVQISTQLVCTVKWRTCDRPGWKSFVNGWSYNLKIFQDDTYSVSLKLWLRIIQPLLWNCDRAVPDREYITVVTPEFLSSIRLPNRQEEMVTQR